MLRSKFLTLLLASLVTASALTGCLGGSDDSDDGSDGSDGTGSDGGDGTGGDGTGGDGTGGDGTGGDGTGGDATPPPKPNNVSEALSLTVGAGINAVPDSPAPASGQVGFSVPEAGWATFTVIITPVSVHADSVTVSVQDPEGGDQGTASFSFSAEAGEPQELSITGGTGGDWTIVGTAGALAQEAKFDIEVSVAY